MILSASETRYPESLPKAGFPTEKTKVGKNKGRKKKGSERSPLENVPLENAPLEKLPLEISWSGKIAAGN